ncbi:MAG TPA: HAD family hydrolase [Gemmatimonadales bacterium]|jgi:phosphonatase-like hydrolase|nr:HAD family hydrolase [Gemmatimonadales bacterium]
MTIRLVVFDVAGTTVHDGDRVAARAMHEALDRAGLTLRDGAMEGVAGMAKPEALRLLVEGHGRDELLPQLTAVHDDFVSRVLRHYRDANRVRAVDGAATTFAELRASGVQVALGSGYSRPVLDCILTTLGWSADEPIIDATIASDEVARGRPYPDMIDALRTRLGGVPYSQVAKVGDTPIDLQEGTMARCGLVVGVLSGSGDRATLAQHPHDHLIDSVAQLPELLDRLGQMPA